MDQKSLFEEEATKLVAPKAFDPKQSLKTYIAAFAGILVAKWVTPNLPIELRNDGEFVALVGGFIGVAVDAIYYQAYKFITRSK